jgi:glutaminyl-peptide cyclotransferase
MHRPKSSTIFLGTSITVALAFALYLTLFHQNGHAGFEQAPRTESPRNSPFDGTQAYEYLKQVCALGPRPSGSEAMLQQQQLLTTHFAQLGGRVLHQDFEVRHPLDGTPVRMKNIVVEWHPERLERILLCAHYDTRPFPDQDRSRPRGVFVGANDGGSGVGLLMELGKHMKQLPGKLGVDFVLFDGEEFVFDENRDRDYYFVGSTHFAKSYVALPPEHRYRCGVLFDMVADAHLEIYQERNSLKFAKSLVGEIWSTANRLNVEEFIRKPRHEVRDDHLPLNEIARIPTCDIIDFDYPRPSLRQSYWHTENDRPENCSAASLAKVGWVIHEWLKKATNER